ncbi:hypothetical protein F511_47438 [Dorcoceras hygrometricum]|uniref:Uncharacterized protein n=1 Tax=Dorcoceras hygrometricum TaxID=472368 RepID=A0A2Z6ZXC5_9LAMI|nr:hypothetical protein F511_47438 [Dorcoceras hygrometricum]
MIAADLARWMGDGMRTGCATSWPLFARWLSATCAAAAAVRPLSDVSPAACDG